MKLLLSVLHIAFCATLACGCATARPRATPPPPAPPSVQYLQMLRSGVDRTRSQMPAIIQSAEISAKRVVAGRRIFIAGSQPDFPSEFLGRCGGMMGMASLPKQFNRGDVVLFGARSKLTIGDRINIDRWRRQGVYVVAFASAALSADSYFNPDVLIDSGSEPGLACTNAKLCPADSVINIINAWTWTGEFVAACTRLGKMPVMYQSYGLPGGRDRADFYRGRMFHDDREVKPIGSGELGNAYLDCMGASLDAIAVKAPATLKIAGDWLRDSGPQRCELWSTGHMFPSHYADRRAPQPFGKTGGVQITRTPSAAVAVVLGYQDAPQIAIDAATLRRTRLLYTSAKRGEGDGRDGIYFVDPHWPIEDACVAIDGYDIPILPASGVLQAAIYWATLAEAFAVPTTLGQPIATSATPGEK
jgi:hypothetical protein